MIRAWFLPFFLFFLCHETEPSKTISEVDLLELILSSHLLRQSLESTV